MNEMVAVNSVDPGSKNRQCIAYIEAKGRQCVRWANEGDVYCCVHLSSCFWAGSANAENPGQVDTPMCSGTTVVGTKCKHRALPGSLYCKKHRPNAETIHVSSLPQSTMKRKHEENYTGSENMFCKDIVLVNGEGSLQVDPVPYIAGNSLHGVNNLSEKLVHSETANLENDGDFLYFVADASVIAFQYGNPDILCKPLVEAKKHGDDLVEAYDKFIKDFFLKSEGSTQSYNQQNLKNTAIIENSADKLWWFQVCTKVAYFQVAPSNDSIRSHKVDTRYHLDLCKNVFGKGIYPDVDAINLYYGGTKVAGSKIVFTNGSQDPWCRASKQISSPSMPSKDRTEQKFVVPLPQNMKDGVESAPEVCA
ncbi:hypothetical protein KIW84_063040 [Lathyrus oleraceus]|uniref:Uncharacterized protein n=1 Tax=Pisum sativum TaxID=3888 RepID=A0A9D4W6M8_PEA|nr:hypothetical protein KIW84_063040 [Pisum sativum]